jgi:hypothetical protein
MPWGSGVVAEEASYGGEWHEPCIQLLEYTDGENAGAVSVRFCSYTLDGRFQRNPLLVGEDDIEGLREALRGAPRLRGLLRRLLEE